MEGPYKERTSIFNLYSTSMFGHVPISSLKLNTSLYLYISLLTFFFLHLVRQEFSRFMHLSNISLSVICFLSSLSSNHEYLSFPCTLGSCSSFLRAFINLCVYIHFLQILGDNELDSVATLPALFCSTLMISNPNTNYMIWIKGNLLFCTICHCQCGSVSNEL